MGLVWFECLEVVISGHTEPYTGNSMSSWVQWLLRHIQSEKLTEPIVLPLEFGKWGGQSDIPFTHTTQVLKSMWVLPLLKLRSRYETDWMMVISCEGDFSLVLLEMFNHPYPTLVVTLNPTVTRSSREWLSYPFPCTNPEVIWKPISLRLSRTISIDLSKSFGVSVLFRHLHPLKVPNMRKKWK